MQWCQKKNASVGLPDVIQGGAVPMPGEVLLQAYAVSTLEGLLE